MPVPLILGAGAAVAGAVGIGNAAHGAVEMKSAGDKSKSAEDRHKKNTARLEEHSKITESTMDELGKYELQILESFQKFSDTIERIQNKPVFKEYQKDGVALPKYDKERLESVSVGAGVILGGLGSAAVGTAGGFAAAGATTSAVMAFGTASTGTAISALHGAVATNAALAFLGGGALDVGGGGMALGATVLGGATLGVGLLVGGIIFNITGSKLSDKADEAWRQMISAEEKINAICDYLSELEKTAGEYLDSLRMAFKQYERNFQCVSMTVNDFGETDWECFSEEEKLATENAVLLVGLLYKMCQVNLVQKAEKEGELNTINKEDIDRSISDSDKVLKDLAA